MSSDQLEKRVQEICSEFRLINQEMQSFLDHRGKSLENPGRLQALKERHDQLLEELNELTRKLEEKVAQ